MKTNISVLIDKYGCLVDEAGDVDVTSYGCGPEGEVRYCPAHRVGVDF
jgi:hypothetical protein